jgi:hypothetical protein
MSDGHPLSSDLMDVITSIEAQFPVMDWSVNGLRVWPLLRIRWAFAEWGRHYLERQVESRFIQGSKKAISLLAGQPKSFLADVSDVQAKIAQPLKRDVVFYSDGVSFVRVNGRWVEKFCDPIASCVYELGFRSALLTPGRNFYLPRYTPSRFIQPALDRASVFSALFCRAYSQRLHLPSYGEVIAFLKRSYMTTECLEINSIRRDVARLEACSKIHIQQLRQFNPKLVFMVGYYGLDGMALVRACRQIAVPIVDIQHGVQGEMHPAYSAWPTLIKSSHYELLPDYFWVWSAWEKSIIDKWSGSNAHKALIGGNPWADAWGANNKFIDAKSAYIAAQALTARSNKKKIVLVTLQYGLSPSEQLLPLYELIRLASSEFQFWVRLHPVMLARREEIRRMLISAGEFELDEPTDIALPALLKYADVHLTHSSSTVIEAAHAGVKSVVTSRYGYELYPSYFRDEIAVLECGTSEKLVKALRKLVSKKVSFTTTDQRTQNASDLVPQFPVSVY